MIYLRFEAGGRAGYGVLEGKTVCEISSSYFGKFKKTGKKFSLSKVKLIAPCQPSKIVAMGLNYKIHAGELKMPLPAKPLFFLKASSALIGPDEAIVLPRISRRVDYEAELAVVIGKKAKNVRRSKVKKYILGYTCFNDVTARDLQNADGQWARSKSFDTFAPVGPWIVGGIDAGRLKIQSLVNGIVKQNSDTSELIFKVDAIVSYVSRMMTLLPGDIVATGTPHGVGSLHAGDKVEVKIDKIGTLSNGVV
jgi:2-keto-4-pentenoate hydratase/2-oxohepta-3-ene-1,7-dioic acid hydratase in catechol pathway